MRTEIELDDATCQQLLTESVIGRLAFWYDGPRLHPVNHAVLDDAVLVRTRRDSRPARLAREEPGAAVAFEVDGVDHADQHGWSVQARGALEEVTDPVEIDRLDRLRPPRPWASGERPTVLRLRWTELSGRQLGTGWDALAAPRDRRLA